MNKIEDREHSSSYDNFDSYTNVEVISDFYEYTNECIKMIIDLDKYEEKKVLLNIILISLQTKLTKRLRFLILIKP